jgi:hypothetical protein
MWVFLLVVVGIVDNFVSSLKGFQNIAFISLFYRYIVPMGQMQSGFSNNLTRCIPKSRWGRYTGSQIKIAEIKIP